MASRRGKRVVLAGVVAVLSLGAVTAVSALSAPTKGAPPVAAPPSPTFGLAVSNDNQNVPRGSLGSFTIAITRKNGFASSVAFTASGVPANATATFVPGSTPGNSVELQVSTTSSTAQGSYFLTVTGTGGSVTATTTAHLTVSASQGGGNKDFAIRGRASRELAPGVTAPIDLSLTNPNNQTLQVTALTVTVAETSKAGCTTDNFRVVQFGGSYPLAVPANSTRTLSQLGVPTKNMPAVMMIDKPVNQDICKSVGLTLGYSGTGTGS